ncbi:diketogulonate reductase-like aldo/keto reductase [Breznakia sp. PFB2-8]|nr:diketogulonate reductase-like aldo/keto reductase [Breznakia sp. PFB2-8]MDF9860711.1 diketogulonate reductase-like aldo/keto reductase [Breznakia sp. PH5-24]
MKDYMLANNISIPSIGFGTWTLDEHDICVAAVTAALESGYRHIDTAAIYKNEAFIGEALKQSSIKREDIFITTKLWNDVRGYDETIQAFETSIAKLGIDYIDLYLIHWPNPVKYRTNWKQMNAESYRAMEDLYNQGKIRAIGVSNFMEHHLDALLETCKIIPMVNQI